MTDSTTDPLPENAGAAADRSGLFKNEYTTTLTLLAATIMLAFPVCSFLVFETGLDRVNTAYGLSCVYVGVMTSLMLAPWLPFPSLRGESTYRRLERMVYIWLIVLAVTALTWEIPWMLLHEQIAGAQDQLWAYTWWAYIDGGDTRYIDPDYLVFFIESWADTNGILTLLFLRLWFKSEKTNPLPVYYFMFAAPLATYPTILYYVSEIAEGMPHVDTSSFVNLWIKFVWANSFWVIVPFFVLWWGKQTLERIYRERYSS